MVKIGNVELAGRLFLAPMAGVTDASFRLLCRKHGAALATSEMISSKALMYQDGKTKTLLVRPKGDTPLAVQIFGSDPSCMAEAACKVIDLCRPEIIDINMGCPVGKVVKSGDGSALMKTPDLAAKIIESVVHAVDVPVTVKFRKGFDKGNINAVPFAEMCESAGAAAIAVHGRTRAQMYAGQADWDIIRDVKARGTHPGICQRRRMDRGGRRTHFALHRRGRGAHRARQLRQPVAFAQGNALLAGGESPAAPPLRARMEEALGQITTACSLKGEKIAILEARKQLCWYLRGVSHAGYYKQQIVSMNTLADAEKIVRGIQRDLR